MFGIDFYTSLSGKMRWCVLSHRVAQARNPVLTYLSALRKKQYRNKFSPKDSPGLIYLSALRKKQYRNKFSPMDLNKIAQGCVTLPCEMKLNNNIKLP